MISPLELSGGCYALSDSTIRFGARRILISKAERYPATACAVENVTAPDEAQRG